MKTVKISLENVVKAIKIRFIDAHDGLNYKGAAWSFGVFIMVDEVLIMDDLDFSAYGTDGFQPLSFGDYVYERFGTSPRHLSYGLRDSCIEGYGRHLLDEFLDNVGCDLAMLSMPDYVKH